MRENIGRQLAELRKSAGMTQEQLSELSGLNRANISKIESGKYNVSIDILGKLCEVLGVEIELNKIVPTCKNGD